MNTHAAMPDTLYKPLSRSLLMLRLGVFVVMLMWTLDKFVNPEHTAKVFSAFYGVDWLNQHLSAVIGVFELLLILAFVAGLWRRWTYAGVLIIHAASTFMSYEQYMDAFDNLLFFAAWPMLAACLALYWLRDWDTLLVVPSRNSHL